MAIDCSTRKVDDLVRALGCDGISKSEVSRICKTLDEHVRTFLGRGIDQECPLPLARCNVPQGSRCRAGDLGRDGGRDRRDQIVPMAMDEMMSNGANEQIARVTEAFLPMKKFNVAELEKAYEGS